MKAEPITVSISMDSKLPTTAESVAEWIGRADNNEIHALQRLVSAATNVARAKVQYAQALDEFLNPEDDEF